MSEVAEMTRVASEIPDGWRTSTVGETAEILDSRRVPLNSEDRRSRSGPYPYWGANGIVDYIDDYIFDEPLVLMAEDGGYFDQAATRPICHRLDGPAWVNNHAHIIRPVGVDRDYFYYWFVHRDITPSIKGGTRAKLNQADLKRLPIWLPPLDEQRRIAEVLRSVDEAIAAAQAVSNATQHAFASVRAELMEEARATSDEVVIADAIAKNRGQKLKKLQTSDYLEDGAFPIIDQGAAFVCGFTDDAAALWPYDLPVIVFGDHTRILKFVDVPFVIGADSTQCITPAAGIDARYMYYALQSLDLRGEGYARHFKLLKEKSMPMPTLPEQCEIAQQLCSLEASVTAADVAYASGVDRRHVAVSWGMRPLSMGSHTPVSSGLRCWKVRLPARYRSVRAAVSRSRVAVRRGGSGICRRSA